MTRDCMVVLGMWVSYIFIYKIWGNFWWSNLLCNLATRFSNN